MEWVRPVVPIPSQIHLSGLNTPNNTWKKLAITGRDWRLILKVLTKKAKEKSAWEAVTDLWATSRMWKKIRRRLTGKASFIQEIRAKSTKMGQSTSRVESRSLLLQLEERTSLLSSSKARSSRNSQLLLRSLWSGTWGNTSLAWSPSKLRDPMTLLLLTRSLKSSLKQVLQPKQLSKVQNVPRWMPMWNRDSSRQIRKPYQMPKKFKSTPF